MSPVMVAPLVVLAALQLLSGSVSGTRRSAVSATVVASVVTQPARPAATHRSLPADWPGLLELLGLTRR